MKRMPKKFILQRTEAADPTHSSSPWQPIDTNGHHDKSTLDNDDDDDDAEL